MALDAKRSTDPSFSGVVATASSGSSALSRAELLVVIVDVRLVWASSVSSAARGTSADSVSAGWSSVWEAMSVFFAAHAALAADQRLALFAAHNQRAALIASGICGYGGAITSANGAAGLFDIEGARQSLARFLLDAEKSDSHEGDNCRERNDEAGAHRQRLRSRPQPQLAAGVARALCYAQRCQLELSGTASVHAGAGVKRSLGPLGGELPARILVLECCDDETDFSHQASSLVSSAFGAQARGVPIDCLSLGQTPSVVFQQATSLSGGSHHHLPLCARDGQTAVDAPAAKDRGRGRGSGGDVPPDGTALLLPALLFHFLPGVVARRDISKETHVMSSAAVCACHGKTCDIAYVCSCCLAIFCRDIAAICPGCQTRFRAAGHRDDERRLRDLAEPELDRLLTF
eukprot:TRINITY_DN17762_c0_g1_i1.p1 TRINITY_DN17762_c0_g1~~TRINITY_DN17762_c0_g1_i1.p1  ORF type:complete len:404 (-),score=50.90 TRINITY_DN17762_c0_g1_i1:276-1487(-)